MSTYIQDIVDIMAFVLNDKDHITYDESVLLAAINQAIISVCLVRPDAYSEIDVVQTKAGSKQTLPDSAIRLISPCYRIEESEQVPVNLVSRRDLDNLNPGWIGQTTGKPVELAYDERLPSYYWCNPPALEGETLELAYTAIPDRIVSPQDEFPLSVKYVPPVTEYAYYLLFSRDSENNRTQQSAQSHLTVFKTLLGMKATADAQVSPVMVKEGG